MKLLFLTLASATLVACTSPQSDGFPVSSEKNSKQNGGNTDFRAVINTNTIKKDRYGKTTAQVYFEDGDTKVIPVTNNGMVRFVRQSSE